MNLSVATDNLASLPEPLRAHAERVWTEFATPVIESVDASSRAVGVLPRVLACSRFLAHRLHQVPEDFTNLLASGDVERAYRQDEYTARLGVLLGGVDEERAMKSALRRFRPTETPRGR